MYYVCAFKCTFYCYTTLFNHIMSEHYRLHHTILVVYAYVSLWERFHDLRIVTI